MTCQVGEDAVAQRRATSTAHLLIRGAQTKRVSHDRNDREKRTMVTSLLRVIQRSEEQLTVFSMKSEIPIMFRFKCRLPFACCV